MRGLKLYTKYTLILACFYLIFPCNGMSKEAVEDIQDISLDTLLNVNISTAAKYEQTMSEAPASVTIITSEDIEQYGYKTLDEALSSVRDFYVSYDRVYAYLGTRGFSRPSDYNNRILLLVNGHSRKDNVYGSSSIGTDFGLPLDIVERIEIVRGPGSVLYGTGAMFAVVNIITKAGKAIDGFEVSAEAGSYRQLQGTALFGKEFDNGMKVLLSGLYGDVKGQDLYYEEYDDPSTNNGIAEGLDWDKSYSLFAFLAYGAFSVRGSLASRDKGDPTGAWGVNFNDKNSGNIDKRDVFEIKYDNNIGNDKNIMLRGYYDNYHYNGTFPYEDGTQEDKNDNDWVGGELQFRWDTHSNNRLVTGMEYQNNFQVRNKITFDEEVYINENYPFSILSFYLHDEYQPMENLSFTVGVRHDEYSNVGGSTIPRVGIVYNPLKSSTLKILYGKAFRAPNIYEVYYDDQETQKGNPDLKPEKIATAEIICEQRLSKGLLGIISVYNYQMKDLMDEFVDPEDSLIQYQNIGKAKAYGLGLELNARCKFGLRGYANYSFQKAKDGVTGEKLTNSPDHTLKLGLVYPVLKYLYVATEMRYETGRLTVYETETDPYLLANIHISTKPIFNHLILSFLIRNILNEEYEFPGGYEHLQDSISQDGRNFVFKAEYKF